LGKLKEVKKKKKDILKNVVNQISPLIVWLPTFFKISIFVFIRRKKS